MKEDKIYYKVVGYKGFSAWTGRKKKQLENQVDRDLILKYEINKWTVPKIKGSKLFVFDSYDNALDFRICLFDSIIYSCVVRNPCNSGPFHTRVSCDIIPMMWKNFAQKKKYTHLACGSPPTGTVWVDAVKLIEKVYIK
jgi:hypothetical protein